VIAAIGASSVRDGQTTLLEAGSRPGRRRDPGCAGRLRVADAGRQPIRLDGGADIRLTTIEQSRWRRPAAGGSGTGAPAGRRSLRRHDRRRHLTAVGTAFDLERAAGAPGGDIVTELSVQHTVIAEGPGLRVTVDEGRGATVRLDDAPTVTTSDVGRAVAAADPWLRANAAADGADGLPLGLLEGIDLAVATAGPTADVAAPDPTPGSDRDAPSTFSPRPSP
jgi:hypothetical protein